MFDPRTDPLGLALRGRARDHRTQMRDQMRVDDFGSPLAQAVHAQGPLPDQNMDAWFQALDEAAGGKPIKMVQGASFGKVDPYGASPNMRTGDVEQKDSALTIPTNQFGSGAPSGDRFTPVKHNIGQEPAPYLGSKPQTDLHSLLDEIATSRLSPSVKALHSTRAR